MNNCINLKIKLNKKIECKRTKKLINLKECSNCPFKEYKNNNVVKVQKNSQSFAEGLQRKSKNIAKIEKNRFSIITNDLEHCINCGKSKDHLHEIFFGRNRLNSIKYGLVVPLCFGCHQQVHNYIEIDNKYKKIGQQQFNKTYNEDFTELFGKNYLP